MVASLQVFFTKQTFLVEIHAPAALRTGERVWFGGSFGRLDATEVRKSLVSIGN
jgi:hypothetical protein